MKYNIIFAEGSLLFLSLLLVIYLNKHQFKDTRTKLYKYLLVSSFIYSIFQITLVLLLKNNLINNDIVLFILWKLQWIIAILWIGIIYLYVHMVCNDIKFNSIKEIIKENIITTIAFIVVALTIIIYLIIPIDKLELINNFTFIPTKNKILFPIYAIIIISLIIIDIDKNKDKLNVHTKNTLKMIIYDLLIILPLQIKFDNISFLSFGFLIEIYILYCLFENPDIKVMDEINKTQIEIEKSNQTKTDFLSNMTCEIQVPMKLIKTLCDELIGMENYDEKLVKEYASQIVSSGNSLIEIINNILDISKIESGSNVLQNRDYKLKDLLTDITNIAKSKIGNKQLKLIVNVDEESSSVLNGDYAKVYQVLVNILTNAIKYTEVGKVTFDLNSSKFNGIEHLQFKVSDTGTGIKDEDKPNMFVKGMRFENAEEIESDGIGLGLAITKEYVDELGGKIWFESQYRVGTTFYIDLHQKIVDDTPIGNIMNSTLENENHELLDCSKYKALIVDDNLLNIKVAKRILEKYKFTVESVTTGKDCIYNVKAGNHYDIIFMDHMMPEMDGIETLHILRKLDGYTLPPIVALTANAVAGMKEMYLNEGFNEYLSKPINLKELDRILNLYFNNK